MPMCAISPSKAPFDTHTERKKKAFSLSRPFPGVEFYKNELLRPDFGAEGNTKIERALTVLEKLSYQGREKDYPEHAIRVALYCLEYSSTVTALELTLALLHNVLEVSGVGPQWLEEEFGDWIARGCKILQIDRKRQRGDSGYFVEYYAGLKQAGPSLRRVKIFDKLDNLLVLFLNPSAAVRADYLQEIEMWLLPFVKHDLPTFEKIFEQLIVEARTLGYQPLERFLQSRSLPL